MRALRLKQPSVLPGFGLTLGFTQLSRADRAAAARRADRERRGRRGRGLAIARLAPVLAAFRVSFGTALAAAVVNAFFGLIVAWVTVRYDFPGRRMVDSLIDLPFALPTAVAGIALTALYAGNGWVGQFSSRSASRSRSPSLASSWR